MDDGDLTQDELLTKIGRMLTEGALQGRPVNDEEYRRLGDNWFMSFRRNVKATLCAPDVLQQLRGNNKDRNTVIGILLNILTAPSVSIRPILVNNSSWVRSPSSIISSIIEGSEQN